jgi:hypothetical protein
VKSSDYRAFKEKLKDKGLIRLIKDGTSTKSTKQLKDKF